MSFIVAELYKVWAQYMLIWVWWNLSRGSWCYLRVYRNTTDWLAIIATAGDSISDDILGAAESYRSPQNPNAAKSRRDLARLDFRMILGGWTILQNLPRPRLNIKTVFPGIAISIIKMRRSLDRLIFILGITILIKRHLHIETTPWFSFSCAIP